VTHHIRLLARVRESGWQFFLSNDYARALDVKSGCLSAMSPTRRYTDVECSKNKPGSIHPFLVAPSIVEECGRVRFECPRFNARFWILRHPVTLTNKSFHCPDNHDQGDPYISRIEGFFHEL
jgi:hypothetical protein